MSCFEKDGICPIDDSGKCCGKEKLNIKPMNKLPIKVIACIPVHGRRPLLKRTIERLYDKNGVEKVICAGDIEDDKDLCESCGAEWIHHPNKPLGAKWNAAFMAAKKYNPDAVLFVGSSDWLSDNWCNELAPLLQQYDMLGTLGCHFIDIGHSENRLVFWPGYVGHRSWESIGIGRLLSSRIMEKLSWKPFDDNIDSGLDGSMSARIKKVGGATSHAVLNKNISSVSLSTYQWVNKHKFEQHWSNQLPSEKIKNVQDWINNNFPEANSIF